MVLSTLTYQIAYAIASGCRSELNEFLNEGSCNEYISFTHYNFFYSYPAWEKKWKDDQESQFHQVHIKCQLCKHRPDRNYAGIGTIYLLNNGVGDKEILVKDPVTKKLEYIPNTPRLSQMICLCKKHIGSHFPYKQDEVRKKKLLQDQDSFNRIKNLLNQ